MNKNWVILKDWILVSHLAASCVNLGTICSFPTLSSITGGGCESSFQILTNPPKAKPKFCPFQPSLMTSPYPSVFAKGRLKKKNTVNR